MAGPGGSIDSVLVHAARLTAEGRPESAIAVLRPVIERYPDSSAAWCRLAAAHLDAGAPAESLAAAKRAMTLGERSWAHRLASLALLELGRYAEAVVSAREAVRRDAADWRCHVALAEALVHDTPAEAVRVAREAVALEPDEARAHEVLGDSTVATHDWLAAERAYRAALRLDPGNDVVAAKISRLARRPPERPAPRRRPVRPAAPPSAGEAGVGWSRVGRGLFGRKRSGGARFGRAWFGRVLFGRGQRFGRAQRVALYLAVRRAAAWEAAGTLVLLIAGLPSPSGLLAWVGLGVVVFVVALAVHGWLGLPEGARVAPRTLSTREPRAAVGAVLLGVSVVVLLGWTVLLALGAGVWPILLAALVFAAAAVAACSLGLRRIWAADR